MYSIEYAGEGGHFSILEELKKLDKETEIEKHCEGFNITHLYKDKEGRLFVRTYGIKKWIEYETFFSRMKGGLKI